MTPEEQALRKALWKEFTHLRGRAEQTKDVMIYASFDVGMLDMSHAVSTILDEISSPDDWVLEEFHIFVSDSRVRLVWCKGGYDAI